MALGANSTIKAGTTSGAITVDLEDGTDSPNHGDANGSGGVLIGCACDVMALPLTENR